MGPDPSKCRSFETPSKAERCRLPKHSNVLKPTESEIRLPSASDVFGGLGVAQVAIESGSCD